MALLPTGQWVRWTNLPSAADFQFTDLHRYSGCKQRFSLNFAAIDISLHANYALILLNTNCTNYTNKVYYQYSVPTIFQVVTLISFFEKCYICSPPQYRSALVVARMRKNSLYDSKSLLFLISKSFGCFKYLKDSLEILGGQSSKILSFYQFL